MNSRLLISLLVFLPLAYSQTQSQPSGKTAVTHHVSGPFEVKVAPLETYNKDDKSLGHFSIEKQFHGGLEATSKGEMLSAGSAPKDGGYVAIEKVTGQLEGRNGSFELQHNATMENGKPNLSIIVVPGSGTGGLAGISGTMNILIEAGKHTYVFDYRLPD